MNELADFNVGIPLSMSAIRLKQFAQDAIRLFHCTFLHRHLPEKIGIYGHSLLSQGAKLDEFLARFLEMGYSFVGPKAFVSRTGRLAFLSFDDNYRSWHDNLAVLERYGVKATFYVNTFPFRDVASAHEIKRYLAAVVAEQETTLTTTELKEIAAAGHTIGAHTHTHPILTSIPLESAKEEIRTSKLILEDILAQNVADFSYPFGLRKHFSSELRRYCHAVGFETVANAIPAMQFAISQADSIHRSPWFFEYPFNYNLDNICVDGRLFERLTARSAVGGRLDRIDKKFDLKVESAQRTRVVLLTNAPAPYRVAFLQHLSRLCDLTVLFDTLSEPNRRWVLNIKDFEFRYKLLKGLSISYVRQRDNSRDQRFMHFRYDILNQLASLRPNVVVSGEMGSRSLQAALYCRLTKTPLIVASEGTLHTERGITKLKIWVRKRLIRRTSRLWSNGRDTTALLESYGADPAKIDAGMTGIDTKTLFIRVNNLLSNRTQIRDELAVDGTVFLFVGQFVERKGILQYLKALDVASRHSRGKWSALFVGSGNRESDLRKWAYDHPEIRVAITGFVQQTELPRYFAAADVFVLPTLDDNWPLASLEALAAGVPQLFSEYNGGTADLLVRGTIGKRINPERTDEFAAAIKEWIETPPHRLSSDDVAEIVEYYSPAALAQRAIISIEKAIQASV